MSLPQYLFCNLFKLTIELRVKFYHINCAPCISYVPNVPMW